MPSYVFYDGTKKSSVELSTPAFPEQVIRIGQGGGKPDRFWKIDSIEHHILGPEMPGVSETILRCHEIDGPHTSRKPDE